MSDQESPAGTAAAATATEKRFKRTTSFADVSETTTSGNEDLEPVSSKRHKKSSVADELICPISLELPFDPVTAEDGQVYERSAIAKHIRDCRQRGVQIKSPCTNLKMGKQLYPSPRTKNLIQSLIDDGVLTGELVNTWNARTDQQKVKNDLLKKAEDGNIDAMTKVGFYCFKGEEGFEKNRKLCYSWFKRAHLAGSLSATAFLGLLIATGRGTKKNPAEGFVHITRAASEGNGFAAFVLGMAYAEGDLTLPVDSTEAIRWLRKCLEVPSSNEISMSEEDEARARQTLEALASSTAGE